MGMRRANNRLCVMETRICAECGASLPSGVSDVFCPACALRGALARDRQPGEGTLLRWFRRLIAQKEDDNFHEKPLASGQNEWRQSLPMGTVAPAQGEVIADYEIVERIGGNMGLVFKARHRLLDKVVVLKLVPADWMADPARLARFQREMRVMGQLEHPNLVTAADARSVGEWHLVAMELIDGVDLQQVVRTQGPLSVAAACEVARQAALGLQYAHQHGLIHRDIKPSNLMLTRAGTIKVIDMGLALARDDSTAQLTQTGFVLGTMSYCAPEQFRDASHVDIRADIYSLGCTLYHLITGKAPYWQRKTVAEIMQAHLHEPFPGLKEVLPDAPAKLEAVLVRMTAKDRDARFSTPNEVVEALEPFARGADLAPLVPASAPQSPPRRATAGKLPSPPEWQRAAGQERGAKARWTRRAALIGFGGAITGGAVLFLIAKGDPVVVLMDTTAPGGIYDADNAGGSNTTEARKALQDLGLVPPLEVHAEPIDLKWRGQARVRDRHPDLVIIHRSSFYHPVNAALKIPRERNENSDDQKRWEAVYRLADDKLIDFMGYVGSQVSRTKFLVYSRGTDPQWPDDQYREQWKKDIERAYRELEGRIWTMVIPGKFEGSFRKPETRELLRSNVTHILRLSDKAK
jgi:hypothetical protein